jgi:hypothetical protein
LRAFCPIAPPATALTLSLFLPLTLLYGAALDQFHRRRFSPPATVVTSHVT